MQVHQLSLFAVIGILALGCSGDNKGSAKVASYQQQVQDMMAKRKQAGKSKFSKEDMQVMQQSDAALKKFMPEPGLKIGSKAPDFTLNDAFGKPVRLYDELKKGPVILKFYRGAWCPFCNIELNTLKVTEPEFRKYSARLIAITPQKPDKTKEQLRKTQYPFVILSDLDSQVMKAYNLYFEVAPELVAVYKKHGLDLEGYNGKGRAVLPVPATYVIDKQGIIRAGFADTDYKKRMEPSAILQALKALK